MAFTVDLESAVTIGGLDVLVAHGLITTTRKTELLVY